MRKFSAFVFLGGCIGFALGTLVLLGPVRWLTETARSGEISEASEAAAVRAVVVGLIVVSALLAGWLSGVVVRTSHPALRFGPLVLGLLLAVVCAGWWFQRAKTVSVEESFVGARFTFGAYPSESRLSELAAEGYTGVISLLHPAVIPFETRLIGEERRAVTSFGLEFIHVPMLPWLSDNLEALAQIEEIAGGNTGRYYVHCLLGRDRVRLVKRWIGEFKPEEELASMPALRRHEESRRLRAGLQWERGEVVLADEGIFITPHPVRSEFISYVLPGLAGQVVSILDPASPEDRVWIEEERRLLEGNGLPLSLLPIPIDPYDAERALEVAKRVQRIPGSKIVHAFLSLDSGRSPSSEAFVQALRSGLAPLPPSLFQEPLSAGPAEVIAPNVAAGPRPRRDEFAGVLWRRGIRGFVYLGDAGDAVARADRRLSGGEGLSWHAVDSAEGLLELIALGGPWYLYGPEVETLSQRVADVMGPAIPPRVARSDTFSP